MFEKLAEFLSYTDDVRQAMDWMMRQGMDFDGSRVTGLEEFLEQLRQEMRQRYRDFNLKNALSEMEQRLEDIVDRERGTLERMNARASGRRGSTRSSASCSGCRAGSRRRFASSKAMSSRTPRRAPISTALLKEYENIRDLENFRDRNQHLFHGPKSLNYQQALELMREMERMRQLEQDLMSGNFDKISMEDLQRDAGTAGRCRISRICAR